MSENRLKKKGPQIGLNIGASSILVVFIVLCLVTFAVLSLVSANADYKLSKRVADRTTSYYLATSEAQKQLGEMADAPRDMEEIADFSVPISDTQSIHVIAKLPPSMFANQMEILSWKIDNTGNWEADDTVEIYKQNQ